MQQRATGEIQTGATAGWTTASLYGAPALPTELEDAPNDTT